MKMMIILKTAIDSNSVIIAIVGYMVVFLSLVLLYWFFTILPKILYAKRRKKAAVDTGNFKKDTHDVSGEQIAAISMALSLYMSEMHDEESGILTIEKVSKAYSPWSSKIYAVRNQFNRL